MARTLIAGNWKMNTTLSDAISLSISIRDQLTLPPDTEVVLFPPTPFAVPVRDAVRGTTIKLGVQNIHNEESGAYTGETSVTMLDGICEYALIGHSERRTLFNESNDFINQKIQACFAHGIKAILCVGETENERNEGITSQVITRQVESALRDIEGIERLVIAYEPIWAIGTGLVPEAEEVNHTLGQTIRSQIKSLYGTQASEETPLLYGGSVNPGNAYTFAQADHIDGVLVGGASLDSAQFVEICTQFTIDS